MDGEVVKQVMAAAMAGLPADMESARLKLGKGQSLTDVKDDAGKTALHVAAERGHVDLVRHLVDAEFSNVDAHRDAQGGSAQVMRHRVSFYSIICTYTSCLIAFQATPLWVLRSPPTRHLQQRSSSRAGPTPAHMVPMAPCLYLHAH